MRIFEHSIGVSVNATKPETTTAPATVSANSVNSFPVLPVMNPSGANTVVSVSDIATTANAISREPSIEAWRGSYLETKIKLKGPLGNTESARDKVDWVDPVIGLYYIWPFSDRWALSLRGDVGGFGVGSEFAWQGVGILRWQVSSGVGVLFAYRYLSNDYEDGKGADYFEYDMSMQGPALGVVFTF